MRENALAQAKARRVSHAVAQGHLDALLERVRARSRPTPISCIACTASLSSAASRIRPPPMLEVSAVALNELEVIGVHLVDDVRGAGVA